MILRGTRRFLDRVGEPTVTADDVSTTLLGDWHATVLLRRSPVALFVNETILLPVLAQLAPARTLLPRFPAAVTTVLTAHGLDPAFVEDEISHTSPVTLAPTADRSVVGIMNEFAFLSEHARADDLVEQAILLARTPAAALQAICQSRA